MGNLYLWLHPDQSDEADTAATVAAKKFFYCPTLQMEGDTGPLPAGEICPGCGRFHGHNYNECMFVIF